MDDDAEAVSGWIGALAKPFQTHPEVAIVAGRILPIWESAPPSWLPRDLLQGYYSLPDFGPVARALDLDHERPITCNMAVRRARVLAAGGFDERLGRRGSNLMSNEDTDLVRRLNDALGVAWYAPDAIVRHLVPRERLRRRWLARRMFAQGRSDVLAGVARERPEYSTRSPVHAVRLLSGLRLLLGAAIRHDQQDLTRQLGRAAHYLGVRYESLRRPPVVLGPALDRASTTRAGRAPGDDI
jgi:GT2 family glycosyltransferase